MPIIPLTRDRPTARNRVPYSLQRTIIAHEGPDSVVARAVGRDLKGKISFVLYLIAIPAAFAHPAIAGTIYFAVALMWLVPDKRIERAMGGEERGER